MCFHRRDDIKTLANILILIYSVLLKFTIGETLAGRNMEADADKSKDAELADGRLCRWNLISTITDIKALGSVMISTLVARCINAMTDFDFLDKDNLRRLAAACKIFFVGRVFFFFSSWSTSGRFLKQLYLRS